MILFGVFLLLKIELEAGSLTIKIAHSKRWRSFEPFRISNKTLRKLVVCGVENVIVIKMSFCCLADAAVIKYTIYTPNSGICDNRNDGQTGVHKSSPIRSKWMTYWPMYPHIC